VPPAPVDVPTYDSDGSEAQAAVQFAMLANHPLLAASDLHVGLL
jgi:hypothetical protein